MPSTRALLIVDVQRDFLPGGALGVRGGNEIISPINRLLPHFDIVVASKDWHPDNTVHFDQWPKHCVRATSGAMFAPSLDTSHIQKVFLKGTGNSDDGYSAFEATNDDLHFYLKSRGATRLFLAGLATDYCVFSTAMDALNKSWDTYIIQEAVRAVNLQPQDGEVALQKIIGAGGHLISMNEIL